MPRQAASWQASYHLRDRRTHPLCWRQVRRVFFVTLIPRALSHALCSACALVSAAVLGRLASLGFGMNILITRDIRMVPAGCAHECNRSPEGMQPLQTRLESR